MPPRAWAPVGAAGEADAEHLPISRAPGSCPVLSLPPAPVLWEARVEDHRSHFGGGSPRRQGFQQVLRPSLGEGFQADYGRLGWAQPPMTPKSWF